MSALDVKKTRSDFPNLHIQVHSKPLVYLDNAATTFKPKCVIEAMDAYYSQGTSNVHRGVHYLSEHATQAFEEARKTVAKFLNAAKPQEIIFTRGATESINLVAQSYGRTFLKAGDEILISHMEHHSNIVPWQILCEQTGCVLKVAPINRQGEIIWKEFLRLLGPKTKIVSVVWVSNSLGTVNPVGNIIKEAHQRGAVVLVDGAQAVTHAPVDVLALDCDFFVFSGHKIFGPTGVGVLYGKEKLLEAMPPYQGGGDMIASVTFPKTTYNILPYKFEAGTPAIAEVIGLGEALRYVQSIGFADMAAQKKELLEYGTQVLSAIPGVTLIGTAKEKTSIISFIVEGIHPHDLGTLVDEEGVAIRTGHHCTQPVMDFFGVPATARASLAFYNTKEELDVLAKAIHKTKELFHA
ncbi:MAG TPA: cysteine desulfurase [Candidatus Omnitrophota bacterium]|nr:cysteine desulfurase [Candidatus Omnitrophota bacterium]